MRGVFTEEVESLRLAGLLRWEGFTAEPGSTTPAEDKGPVLLAGLGPRAESDPERLRAAASAAAALVPGDTVRVDLASRTADRLGAAESVRAVVAGLALTARSALTVTLTGLTADRTPADPGEHTTTGPAGPETDAITIQVSGPETDAITIQGSGPETDAITIQGSGPETDAITIQGSGPESDTAATGPAAPYSDAVTAGLLDAEALALARELVNRPPSELVPDDLASIARDVATREGLAVRILDERDLHELGMGALLGMGAGSPHPPRLVDLRYEPPDARCSITLVGKGITFDSGGLSLKSPAAMMGMRSDMAGAAVVLAVMSVLARRGLPVAVRGLLPLAENMIGPNAVRPGDVLRACDGRRIQVLDTDFEGRVTLADALALAARERPDAIVDVATLTYQIVTALGPEIGGVLGRDRGLTRQVLQAGALAGEPLWALPWARRYRGQITSSYAEVRNFPEADTGRAITAALLLGEFVPEDIPFAHLDISGPAWRGPASGHGATGFGVLTLTRLLESAATREVDPDTPLEADGARGLEPDTTLQPDSTRGLEPGTAASARRRHGHPAGDAAIPPDRT
ncbi:leucyl aminopeptidase family protein [Sphaerisporangium perillae]|uniref:leucyl aminopeptidase family protein n=1 Tax=Sphaerisporangium perillae TaxID=2935860 RepID=UPI00200E4976|nr:leucyl aminopeptidase family protein [Sphaerisporangium perillae]